jgi:hypothetical protein
MRVRQQDRGILSKSHLWKCAVLWLLAEGKEDWLQETIQVMTMNTEHDKPTPPPGFKLVKGAELKAPFDARLLVFTDEDTWDESVYAGSNRAMLHADFCSWYAIPEQSISEEAAAIVAGERQSDYGDANESFARIANLWSAYTGSTIEPWDVAQMMILLKVSRAKTSKKRDTLVDIIGYAECAGKLNKAE